MKVVGPQSGSNGPHQSKQSKLEANSLEPRCPRGSDFLGFFLGNWPSEW